MISLVGGQPEQVNGRDLKLRL